MPTPDRTPTGDLRERFEGRDGRECGEHRTTGRRAWCSWCTEWCYPHAPCKGCEMPALRKRCEQAERQHAEALDQIATERRGRLAAEAAVGRACELADRAEMTADVIDPDGTRIQFAAVAVRDLRPALAIKQPKETP